MAFPRTHAAVVAAAFLLSSCSFFDDALFPSTTPEDDNSSADMSSPSVTAEPPVISSATLTSLKATEGQPTGTFVGQKVISLRSDLVQLQSTLSSQNAQLQQDRAQLVQDTTRFNGTVAAINTRLQLGTTPGNPILVRQWNDAQGELDQINADVLTLNRLASDVASTSGMAAYILDSVRAARSLSGAVDDDFRQLQALEDDTNATTVLIDRLLTDISAETQRQQTYLGFERGNLDTLAVAIKNGQFFGTSLADMPRTNMSPAASGTTGPVGLNERPLVVIRFNRPNVSYEDALYAAVKGALDRRPNAVFDVVAVTPGNGAQYASGASETSSRRNADAVVRSLTRMGLPQDRVRLSAETSTSATSGEVQVFVR